MVKIIKIEQMPKVVYDYRKMITPISPVHVLICQTGHEFIPQLNKRTKRKVKIDLCSDDL